ncbi:MAG: GDP-mannose 4,6-dehydratase [Elusimicrobiota bacterium]
MSRILVTGGTGFLARPLVELLRRNLPPGRLQVTSLVPGPGVLKSDLLDAGSARRLVERTRPELVFHLAGMSASASTPPDVLWRVHVTATLNLFKALRALPSRARVVVVGSSREYGSAGAGRLRETSPTEPVGEYGASKLGQTLAALSFCRQGLDVRVARIFNVFGQGMPKTLALGSFASQIAAIEAGVRPAQIRVGNLSSRRDYVDVRDVARALALLARWGESGEVYNVCSGRSLTMKWLLRKMLSMSQTRIAVVLDPGRVRAGDVSSMAGSHAKLTRATGWTPKVPLEKSLRDTLAWHRQAWGFREPEGRHIL